MNRGVDQGEAGLSDTEEGGHRLAVSRQDNGELAEEVVDEGAVEEEGEAGGAGPGGGAGSASGGDPGPGRIEQSGPVPEAPERGQPDDPLPGSLANERTRAPRGGPANPDGGTRPQ